MGIERWRTREWEDLGQGHGNRKMLAREWKGRGHRNGNIWGKGNVGGRIRKSE